MNFSPETSYNIVDFSILFIYLRKHVVDIENS